MTKGDKGNTAYECKWTTDLFRSSEVKDLIEESEFLKPYRVGGFSKSGYSEEALARLDLTYTVDDLYT